MDWIKKEKNIKIEELRYKEAFQKYEIENYYDPISKFKSLTTSLKFYEVLMDIKLILHIRSDEETLKQIKENIYNIKAIGRSEDNIDIEEAAIVELFNVNEEVVSKYSAYLDYEAVKNKDIIFSPKEIGINITGTKYFLNKNYEIIEGKRKFVKKKVFYSDNYVVDKATSNKDIFIDKIGTEKIIVNFL